MIEQDLYSKLEVIAPTYPIKLPQDVAYPAITYFVVTDIPNQSLFGNVFARFARIQVDIWAKSYNEIKNLKNEVVSAIVELRGGEIASQDLFEDDVSLYRELLDFTIRI